MQVRQIHLSGKSAPRNRERGSILIEALIAMAVIAVTFSAFTTGMLGATQTQRDMQHRDIASQAANAVVEKGRTIAWDRLGIRSTDPNRRDVFRGANTVYVSTANFPAVQTVTTRGLAVTLRTDITWDSAYSGTFFGRKRIEVSASWTDADGASRSATFLTYRQANVTEAAPLGITEDD